MAARNITEPHAERSGIAQAGPGGPVVVEHLGTIAYELCRELLVEVGDVRENPGAADRIFVAEHFPVFSIGTHRDIDLSLRDSLPAPLIRTNGAQSLAFHGPGQVTAHCCVLIDASVGRAEVLQAFGSAARAAVVAFGIGKVDAGPFGLLINGRRAAWWHVRIRGRVVLAELTLDVTTAAKWREPRDRACAIPSTTLAEHVAGTIDQGSASDRLVEALAAAFRLQPRVGLAGVIGPAGVREQ